MSVVIIVLLVCDMLHMYVYCMTCKEACDYCYCWNGSTCFWWNQVIVEMMKITFAYVYNVA